jgi:hypothetical protein
MQLPPGVTYRPRHDRLIARNEPAVIQIRRAERQNSAYVVDKPGEDYLGFIAPRLKGDWEDFDRVFQLARSRVVDPEHNSESFFGNAICSDSAGFQLPNIHVIANIPAKKGRVSSQPFTVFGCSMGELHRQFGESAYVDQVIEFQSFGAVTIDQAEGEIELWIARDGDKVAIWSGSHSTIYNLDDENNPLVFLSVVRRRTNEEELSEPADDPRSDLSRKRGPVLLGYYDDREAVFTLNRLHVNTRERDGVRLSTDVRDRRDREMHIPRGARLSLGALLYEELTSNPDRIACLARLGIRVRRAAPEVVLPRTATSPTLLYVVRPLRDALSSGSEMECYFQQSAPEREPRPRNISRPARTEAASVLRRRPIELKRNLTIVVEGAGEWVVEAYRDLFKRKVDRRKKLTVFYADDTRWKASRPVWADTKAPHPSEWDGKKSFLQPWEIYLDKADPKQYARYLSLRPDVVFIVTPDFTHSTLARQWVGKAPLVFVEKPFDSQLPNIDALLRDMAGDMRTRIYGLDHYQFYAAPVPGMQERILKHLDGALSGVTFYLTEKKRIEKGRVRTLQHGLTLDLLPHMIALLTYFGDIKSIDDIRILEKGCYLPFEDDDGNDLEETFQSEAYSKVRFTMLDTSNNGFRVPCYAVVGKGFPRDVKYMEVTGRAGNSVRIDLTKRNDNDKRDKQAKGARNGKGEYPADAISFLLPAPKSDLESFAIVDPYNRQRTLHVVYDREYPICRLDRGRYELLLDDLLGQTDDSIGKTLTIKEGRHVVDALDRIWRAIQSSPQSKTQSAELTLDPPAPGKRIPG